MFVGDTPVLQRVRKMAQNLEISLRTCQVGSQRQASRRNRRRTRLGSAVQNSTTSPEDAGSDAEETIIVLSSASS